MTALRKTLTVTSFMTMPFCNVWHFFCTRHIQLFIIICQSVSPLVAWHSAWPGLAYLSALTLRPSLTPCRTLPHNVTAPAGAKKDLSMCRHRKQAACEIVAHNPNMITAGHAFRRHNPLHAFSQCFYVKELGHVVCLCVHTWCHVSQLFARYHLRSIYAKKLKLLTKRS